MQPLDTEAVTATLAATAAQQRRRFLLAMWEGGGTVPPELGLARRLIARGHEVHVIADPTIEREAAAAGCTSFQPWIEAPHCATRTPEAALVRDWEYKSPLDAIGKYVEEFLCAPADRYARDMLRALDATGADVVLCDFVLVGASMAAELRGVLRLGLMPNIYMFPVKGIPPLGPGLQPARGLLGHARDALMRAVMVRMFGRGTEKLNAARSRVGLDPVSHPIEQMLRVDEMLVLTSPSFDLQSPHMAGHVRYVGPVLDDPTWSGGGAGWTPPWPENDRDPLVLVGLSSSFQDQAPLLRRIVDALAPLPLRTLVTLGEQIRAEDVPARGKVRVVRAAPHAEVLRHAAAVITHCGHGTTIKSLAAGVPLLCIPMGRDQNDTAVRVTLKGAGLRLQPSASGAQVAVALRRILDEPRFRACAQALGATIRAELAACDPADALLQRVAVLTAQRSSATAGA